LRQRALRLWHQQAMQASEGKFVVQQARRLFAKLTFPEHFSGQKRLVEMEARRVEGTQQGLEPHAADTRRAQGADRVEHHRPGSGAAAFHDFDVLKTDGVQLQKNQRIFVRLGEFLAASERLAHGDGKFCMAWRQGRRKPIPQACVEAALAKTRM
jgi:hypothetical protein